MLVTERDFYGRENPALTEELLTEAADIFRWSLEGLDRLYARGHFTQAASGAEALQALEDLASPVATFARNDASSAPPATSLPMRCSRPGRHGAITRA